MRFICKVMVNACLCEILPVASIAYCLSCVSNSTYMTQIIKVGILRTDKFKLPLGKERELASVLLVHVFVYFPHVNFLSFFSSSWCRGFSAACDCGPLWTFY